MDVDVYRREKPAKAKPTNGLVTAWTTCPPPGAHAALRHAAAQGAGHGSPGARAKGGRNKDVVICGLSWGGKVIYGSHPDHIMQIHSI